VFEFRRGISALLGDFPLQGRIHSGTVPI
jgi:hypothetical protein